jgi:hypothetical protein
MRLAGSGAMTTVTPKSVVRDALIGFGIGLLLMLGIGYGAAALSASPPAAPTSTQ